MQKKPPTPTAKPAPKRGETQRAARLAATLKENLKRRKGQETKKK